MEKEFVELGGCPSCGRMRQKKLVKMSKCAGVEYPVGAWVKINDQQEAVPVWDVRDPSFVGVVVEDRVEDVAVLQLIVVEDRLLIL